MGRQLGVVVAVALGACTFSAAPGTGPDGGVDVGLGPTVGFLSATSLQDELSGSGMVPVGLSAPATTPISISYAIREGTATSGVDYTATDGTLTFMPGETEHAIAFGIVGDSLEEQDEKFSIELHSLTGDARLGTASHSVTISANVLPRVSFALTSSSELESTPVAFLAVLDTASAEEVRVDFVLGGSATTADYGLRNGTFVFPPGNISKSVPLAPVDDALDEDDELVRATLTSSNHAVVLASAATRQHTLRDNDPLPKLSFVGTSRTVDEDVAMTTITVQLTPVSGRQVSVPFTVSGGATAALGDDYTLPATSTLVFPAGTTEQTITVVVLDDTRDEIDETFTLALGSPTNADLVTTADTFAVTIRDDDNPPQLSFDPSEQDGSAIEGTGTNTSFDYRIVLSAPSGKQISFTLGLSGTVETNDFTINNNGLVTFNPGQMARTVRVTVIGDTANNPADGNTETLVMTIPGTVANAVPAAPLTRSHTIIDDD